MSLSMRQQVWVLESPVDLVSHLARVQVSEVSLSTRLVCTTFPAVAGCGSWDPHPLGRRVPKLPAAEPGSGAAR